MKILRYLLFTSSLLLGSHSSSLFAEENGDWFTPFSWEAFVSQSVIYSSDYDYLSRSDDEASLDMWEAGLLFSTTVKGSIGVSAQLLGRKVSESSGEDIRLDYGFFSYPIYQSFDRSLGLRLGRIRSSYGFYNETRDIPHTRTGVVMPQAVYFDMTRNSFYSADGVEFFGSYDLSGEPLAFQLFLSQPVADKDELEEASQLSPSKLKGDRSLLAKIIYGEEFDGWRASITYFKPEYEVSVEFPAGDDPLLMIVEPDASFYSENIVTSLEYNQFQWSVTFEYLRHKFQTNIPALASEAVNDFYEEAYYLQSVYRFDEFWEMYARYEQTKLRGSSDPKSSFDDANFGLAFRPDENWLLRAEIHYIEGYSRLFSRDNSISDEPDPYWTAVLFQLAYRW